MPLSRSEWALIVFTLGYAGVFLVRFLDAGNVEFIGYLATLLFFAGLIAATRQAARYPSWLLWSLSIWGLAHMAGGGVKVDGAVLYALVLVPIAGSGELTILKYDQVVHFYGFGVAALMLWHIMRRNFPALDGTRTIFAFAVLGSMGLGALNEIVEFVAVLALPDTNVGGYYNTGLDLVFNAAGAVIAITGLSTVRKHK